jgi:hypothetical protein
MFSQPDYYETRRANKAQEMNQILSVMAGLVPKPKSDIEKLTEVLALQAKMTQAQQDQNRMANLPGGLAQPPMGASAPQVKAPSLQQLASLQGAGAGGGLIPTGANLNAVTGDLSYSFGKDKAADKRAEDQYSQEKQLSGTGRFLQQFGRSWEELKGAYGKEIGEKGYSGWATRGLAKVNTALDNHPETKAFLQELEPIANQMARDIEGGKITDKDRDIYAKSFANTVKNPSATNVRLASNNLLKMRDKGGNIESVLNELRNSDIDIMQSIALEVDKDELRKLKATIGRK